MLPLRKQTVVGPSLAPVREPAAPPERAARIAPRVAQTALSSLRARLSSPVDAAWLVALRVLYAALVGGGALRLLWLGAQPDSQYAAWIDAFFVNARFHFKYYGFHWVQPPPGQ